MTKRNCEGICLVLGLWFMIDLEKPFDHRSNLTLIGSTANIVAIGMLERRKRGHITFFQWMRAGAVVSIPTLILAVLLIFLQIPLMPR